MNAMTYAEMRALYPDLNEQGIANYLAMENRTHTAAFAVEIAFRRAKGECLWCRRFAVRVLANGDYICDECWDTDSPDLPLDMTDLNREGDPAWNGAFDRW